MQSVWFGSVITQHVCVWVMWSVNMHLFKCVLFQLQENHWAARWGHAWGQLSHLSWSLLFLPCYFPGQRQRHPAAVISVTSPGLTEKTPNKSSICACWRGEPMFLQLSQTVRVKGCKRCNSVWISHRSCLKCRRYAIFTGSIFQPLLFN